MNNKMRLYLGNVLFVYILAGDKWVVGFNHQYKTCIKQSILILKKYLKT